MVRDKIGCGTMFECNGGSAESVTDIDNGATGHRLLYFFR